MIYSVINNIAGFLIFLITKAAHGTTTNINDITGTIVENIEFNSIAVSKRNCFKNNEVMSLLAKGIAKYAINNDATLQTAM